MRKSKKLVIVFLVFIFTMPGVCAYWFYQHPDWLSGATTNKGQLLAPAVLVKDFPKTAKWGLVLWNPGPCKAVCRQQLNKLSRIRLALGRRFYGVNLWLMTQGDASLHSKKTANLLHQQRVQSVIVSQKTIQALPVLGSQSRLFLMNPDNYLILRYPLAADPADIYTDLQRIMNVQRSL